MHKAILTYLHTFVSQSNSKLEPVHMINYKLIFETYAPYILLKYVLKCSLNICVHKNIIDLDKKISAKSPSSSKYRQVNFIIFNIFINGLYVPRQPTAISQKHIFHRQSVPDQAVYQEV